MHFEELMEVSGELKELAEEIGKGVHAELTESISLLRAGWNSVCADAFAGKEVEAAGEIARQAEELAALAQEIEKAARKMYQSEMANQERARIRIYL